MGALVSDDATTDLIRRVDEKLTDVRDRVIRIEAQNHGSLIAALRADHEKLREDYSSELTKVKLDVERMKTKVAPLLTAIGMAGGAFLMWLSRIIG